MTFRYQCSNCGKKLKSAHSQTPLCKECFVMSKRENIKAKLLEKFQTRYPGKLPYQVPEAFEFWQECLGR